MTSWRIVICLFLFVSLIQICQGGCQSVYFKMDHFGEYPTTKLALVKGTNLKDMVECTYERECLTKKDINISHIIPIFICLGRTNTNCIETQKCKDLKSERNISYYNLLCMAAIALNASTTEPDSIDCEYSELIHFIGNSPKAVLDQRTKQPTPFTTTTQPERTTAAPTVMQSEPPTTTVQPTTTQPERTTAAPTVMQPEPPTTTVQPTTTQPERTTAASPIMQPKPTKTTSGQKDLQMGNGTSRSEMRETGINLLMAAGLGLMLAILPALVVYVYMRQQRRDLMQDAFIVRNGEHPNVMSETQSSTPKPTANRGGVEARLLQAEDCHTVVTDSAL